jgi:hypothetical protein
MARSRIAMQPETVKTLQQALAWCLVWLMAPELGVGPFLARSCRQRRHSARLGKESMRPWAETQGRWCEGRNGYGVGVAWPVMSSGGTTKKPRATARSWPSLRISPATLPGI